MKLSELKEGESGVIVKVTGHGGFRKRIVEMGFISGQKVEVLINAPLKDPVKYRIMGYEVSLRHSEAEMIEVVGIDESETLTSQPSSYQAGVEELINARKIANKITSEREKAIAYHDTVAPKMEEIRYQIDKLELIVSDELWTLPKYRELLFIR